MFVIRRIGDDSVVSSRPVVFVDEVPAKDGILDLHALADARQASCKPLIFFPQHEAGLRRERRIRRPECPLKHTKAGTGIKYLWIPCGDLSDPLTHEAGNRIRRKELTQFLAVSEITIRRVPQFQVIRGQVGHLQIFFNWPCTRLCH